MKKVLSNLLVLSLLLCAVPCLDALAEGATLIYDLPDTGVSTSSYDTVYDVIYGSDYLCVMGDGGHYLASMDGTQISEADFDSEMIYRDGLIVASHADAEGINVRGALDVTGAEVIPFEYGDIYVYGAEWAVGIKYKPSESEEEYDCHMPGADVNCDIESVDLINLKGAGVVATLDRAQYQFADSDGELLYVQDRDSGAVSAYDAQGNVTPTEYRGVSAPKSVNLSFYDKETGLYGLKDADGNVVLEPTYTRIYAFEGEYARVTAENEDIYGMIDRSGALVIPVEYDEIERCYSQPYDGESNYENGGYFCVVKDGKIGFVKAGGEVTCELKYDMDAGGFFNQGISTIGNVDGKTIVLAADGVETEISTDEYSYADAIMSCTQGRFYRVSSPNYDYGVIDWHGNEVLPCEYHSISPFGDGKHVLVSTESNDGKSYQVYELADPLEAE